MNMKRKAYFRATSATLRDLLDMKTLKPLKRRFLQQEQHKLVEQSISELFTSEFVSHIKRVEIKNYHTLELYISGEVWYQGMLKNMSSINKELQDRHSWIKKIDIIITK